MNASIPSPNTLSESQARELAAARIPMRRIRRASAVAAFSGWSMAIFAALTLISAFFGGPVAIALGVALCAIAWNELRGGRLLRQLDRRGPRVLGWNQLALGVVIVAYSAWTLVASLTTSPLASFGGSTGDASVDALVTELATLVSISLYSTMIVVGVVVPGLTAWYYFSRAASLKSLHAIAPGWVVQTLRLAA